jgi:hypothetical protein
MRSSPDDRANAHSDTPNLVSGTLTSLKGSKTEFTLLESQASEKVEAFAIAASSVRPGSIRGIRCCVRAEHFSGSERLLGNERVRGCDFGGFRHDQFPER